MFASILRRAAAATTAITLLMILLPTTLTNQVLARTYSIDDRDTIASAAATVFLDEQQPLPRSIDQLTSNNYIQLITTPNNNYYGYYDPYLTGNIARPVMTNQPVWNYVDDRENGELIQKLMQRDEGSRIVNGVSRWPTKLDDLNLDLIDELIDPDYLNANYPSQPLVIKFTEISGIEPFREEPDKKQATATTATTTTTTTTTQKLPQVNLTHIPMDTKSANLLNFNSTNRTANSSSLITLKIVATPLQTTTTTTTKKHADSFSHESKTLVNDLHKNLKSFRSKIASSKYDQSFDDELGFAKLSSERLIHKRVPSTNAAREHMPSGTGNGR